MNTPKIRFKGFEDDWEQRKVGDYYEFKNGLNKGKEFFGKGTPIVNFTDVFHNRGILSDNVNGKVLLEEKEIENFNVKKGDIFFTRTSETIEEIGYPSVMLDTPENTVFSGFVLRGRCYLEEDPLDDLFKKYVFFTDAFRTEMLKKSSMTTRALTSGTAIKGMEFLHPSSKDEQHKIGEYFTTIDHLITLHQRKCDETKELKKFMLQKLFPKNGQKNPEIRFEGFTDDWEQRKFGDIASSFEYGLNVAAKEYDGQNKYIRITDIDDNTHEFLTDSLTSPDIDLTGADNYKLIEGDILFARTGASVGKSYIYRNSDGLVYYAGFLIRARIKEECDVEFVFQNTLTDRYNKYIAVTSQRSGQPGVNAQEYAEFEIKVPKKEEQTKIGTYFRNLDHLITLHQRKCCELKKLKQYMANHMFVNHSIKCDRDIATNHKNYRKGRKKWEN